MDSIVVGFSRPKAWLEPFSWLIRLVTWSQFSHAYIRYYNSYADRWTVLQASGLAVNYMGGTLFDTKEDICAEFELPISSATKLTTVQFGIDRVGLPYSMETIFGICYVMILRLFGKKVTNPFASTSSFVCSELVAQILNEINGTNLDSSTMTPKDVYSYLVSKGYKQISAQ